MRLLLGGVAALLLVAAGIFWFTTRGAPGGSVLPLAAKAPPAAGTDQPLPDEAPAASEKSREEKRFARFDKDNDAKVTRDELLAPRRKAFAKLDANGDGALSFEEWSARTTNRFAAADANKDGALDRVEFATTAPKRRPKPRCLCPTPPRDDSDDN